ncbi:PGPGW domain-containing protein [Desulfobulbus oligotrophicus]|jgi:hypothetical protein|uniref:Transmembrane protein (PGPGW) n=1 Tax=Desulfobulbus oligotrophicus TaxID=1909699 RepID=A0A7T5VFD8_9BACT|nr:PGPGW domain-containing protein [Desulfobulbus oligotrophicus]MDY0389920.1 PGPGW domain-containing protein [Desulfobulbus oligotrophicus]QQG66821.1 hypothetical protein HP555_13585 [Desulfobulbus oligotrophicus]
MYDIGLLEMLGLLSLLAFIGSLVGVPWLIGRMQSDYFLTHRYRVNVRHRRHPVLTLLITCIRNSIGFCVLLAGIAMLFLPGQGVLTILIAICLMDFPGKRRLLDRLASSPQIINALNWIRRKQGKVEFVFAEQHHERSDR